MKIINILLNLFIIMFIVFGITTIIIYFAEPYMYNRMSTGTPIKNYNDMEYVYPALDKYINYYRENNIDSIKECTSNIYKKNEEVYKKGIENLDIYNGIFIDSVQKCPFNVYIVQYYFNYDDKYNQKDNKNKLIIKINKTKKNFIVYYDSIVDMEE